MLDMRGFKGRAGESLGDLGAASEEILHYPHSNVRIRHNAGDPVAEVATYLYIDQLGSVRMVTNNDPDADGSIVAKETTYRPFGEAVDFAVSLTPPEVKAGVGDKQVRECGNVPVNMNNPRGNEKGLYYDGIYYGGIYGVL